MNQPLLTYVLASRNDQFCGNSLARLEYTLLNLRSLQPDAEIILVDWGTNLGKTLNLKCRVRTISVPAALTKEFPVEFSEVHALNVGIRRASGIYVARLDQDILIGERYANWTQSLPECGTSPAYFSLRRDLPAENADGHAAPIWNNWTADSPGFWRGAVGILLARRMDWLNVGGYDENLIWRNHMEHDLCLRFKHLYGLENLGVITDCDFYHQFHERVSGRRENPMPIPEREDPSFVRVNTGVDWGYLRWKFDEVTR